MMTLHSRRSAPLIVLFLSVVFAPLAAEPGYSILENATALVGDPLDGVRLESTSIVLRRGVIVAIGADANVLPDAHLAERIDCEGLIVHAAFIDAWTQAGMPDSTPSSPNAGKASEQREGPRARSPEARRNGVFAERQALNDWALNDADAKKYRSLGFATLGVASTRGTLTGESSLVGLAGGPRRNNVVAPALRQQVRFRSSGSGYPGSLMGVIAHLRQTFLDTRHYRDTWRLYREEPRGLTRPPYDTALEALTRVVDREQRATFHANDQSTIRRALRLADELGLLTTIAGGRDAYLEADVLRAREVPVLLVPQKDEAPKVEASRGRPPVRVQEDQLRIWRERAGAAQRLTEAEVPFAFGSGDLKPTELLRGVRAAVKEGLSDAGALRALTLSAAELAGVSETLGSIDVGKSATIVARRGDPLAKESAVRYLFIDGGRFEFELPKEKKDDKEEESTEKDSEEKPPAGDAKEGEIAKSEAVSGSDEESDEELSQERPSQKEEHPLRTELDADRVPKLKTGGSVLIRGGTVLTLRGEALEKTDLRIRDGVIEALGQNLSADEGEAQIDATGWYVMPGIVDCHSHLATDGGVNESTESVTAEVRIADVLDPFDIGLYRAAAGGVTTSNILHGSANAIGGQNAVVRHRYRSSVEKLLFPGAWPGVKFALGENPRRANWGSPNRFPATRSGVEAVYYRALSEAKTYAAEWEEYSQALVRGERRLPPRRDLRVEALLEILRRERVVHCHCYRADEILMLLNMVKQHGLHLATLQHVLEGYKVAPEIAAAGAGASTFSDWWAYKIEAFDAVPYNSAMMVRAGVSVSVNSDDAEMVRRLNQEAAKGVRFGGLSYEDALKTITINAAEQLGIDDRVGTLEVGKDGDVAVFDAHPLSVYARCRYTLVRGEVVFERGGEREHPHAKRRPLVAPSPQVPKAVAVNPTGTYLLRGARVVTVSDGVLETGDVLVQAGRIAAVSASVAPPEGASVIDAAGLTLLPGFIDAGSELGLREIDSVDGSVDVYEVGSIHPDLLAASAVNAHSELIPVARSYGVTATATFLAARPAIAGQACLLRLDGRSTAEMVFAPRLALHVRMPRVRGDEKETPEAIRDIEKFFAEARSYSARREAEERGDATPGARDRRLDAMRPYLDRRRPVVFAANRQATIEAAVSLADRLRVRAVIKGGREAWKVPSLLARSDIPVILGPIHALPYARHDPYDAPYTCAGELQRAGVPLAFQASEASLVGNLPFQVGTAVAFGLDYDAAIYGLTLGAAKTLGVDRELGSIEVGKLADLILVEGDPLEITSRVHHVFIGGRPVDLTNRHNRLYREFRDRQQLPSGSTRRF